MLAIHILSAMLTAVNNYLDALIEFYIRIHIDIKVYCHSDTFGLYLPVIFILIVLITGRLLLY